MRSKICGITDIDTLKFLVNHKYPPEFIGFIVNFPKSKRYLKLEKLKKLVEVKKKKSFYVAVLVNPNQKILDEIKELPFDYYQIYDCQPNLVERIKNIYNKKIISAFTIENLKDIEKYKNFKNVSDIYLFDSKGYEKSLSFEYSLLNGLKFNKDVMIAGNIQIDDDLEKFSKIADIIDISGGVETLGLKDVSKIEIFLNKIRKINNEN